jgi:hypothetical protein
LGTNAPDASENSADEIGLGRVVEAAGEVRAAYAY